MIQDALNSINKAYRLPIFLDTEIINRGRKNNGAKESESVDFEINSCGQENSHEQGDNILNSYENIDEMMKILLSASNEIISVNRSYHNEFICIAPGRYATPIPFSHKFFCEIFL